MTMVSFSIDILMCDVLSVKTYVVLTFECRGVLFFPIFHKWGEVEGRAGNLKVSVLKYLENDIVKV